MPTKSFSFSNDVQVEDVCQRFAAVGVLAMYGGGVKSKGHGFWMYEADAIAIDRIVAARWFTHLDDVGASILVSPARSGNPHFWMFDDASSLLLTLEDRP